MGMFVNYEIAHKMSDDDEIEEKSHYRGGPKYFTPRHHQGGVGGPEAYRVYTEFPRNNFLGHDPDGSNGGVVDIRSPPWDGVVIDQISSLTNVQLLNKIWGTGTDAFTMFGLRDLFYEKKPFRYNWYPTVYEMEQWTLEVLKHIRRMFGYNPDTLVMDRCMCLRSQWWVERGRSNAWENAPNVGYDTLPANDADGPQTPIPVTNPISNRVGRDFYPRPEDHFNYFPGSPCPNTPVFNRQGNCGTYVGYGNVPSFFLNNCIRNFGINSPPDNVSVFAMLEPFLLCTKIGFVLHYEPLAEGGVPRFILHMKLQ